MGIAWSGGAVWRWAGSGRRSRTDDMERGTVVREASWLTVDDRAEREEEIYCARRRKRTGGAETPKTFAVSIVVSCGGGDRERWRTELDFDGSEPF